MQKTGWVVEILSFHYTRVKIYSHDCAHYALPAPSHLKSDYTADARINKIDLPNLKSQQHKR